MKLCVVVPSEEHLSAAGVRIRYQRLQKPLERLGVQFQIRPVEQFQEKPAFGDDFYLIPESDDTRGILLAMELSRRGALVGVDLLDDYFSQGTDSRFVHRRQWLRQISSYAQFFLCSTPRMRTVAEDLFAGKATHILNDPAEFSDWDPIAQSLSRKLEWAHTRREIAVAWVGKGDHPHFPVGLSDLCAFGHVLRELEQHEFQVRLKVLTNLTALGRAGLEQLQRLPVRWSVEEFSAEKEKQTFAECLVAFLPVNGLAFSRAQSLNRALSALCAGSQVLSVGFPLYESFNSLVYRSSAEFLQDLVARKLRLRGDTLSVLARHLKEWGDPTLESEKLNAFLRSLRPHDQKHAVSVAQHQRTPAVLHGTQSPVATHKFAQKLHVLSIGTPWSSASLNFDIHIMTRAGRGQFLLQIEPGALPLLHQDSQSRATQGSSATGRTVHLLDITGDAPLDALGIWSEAKLKSKAERLIAYPHYLAAMRQILERFFPTVDLFVSENQSPYYYQVAASSTLPPQNSPALV